MAGGPSNSPTPGPTAPVRDSRLRVRAIPIFVLLLAEILLGNQLAVVGSPYPIGYLAAHVALSLLLVGFTGHAFVLSVRLPKVSARACAGLTFLATLGATVSGTLFLLAGESSSALVGMESLGGLALLGALLLMVFGSVKVPSAPAR